jgi:hypothetical protein
MPSTKENPKSVFGRLPRKDLSRFGVNERGTGESIEEFVARSRLTPAEVAWVDRQPVHGAPSLRRLRANLAEAGFADIRLGLNPSGEELVLQVRLTHEVDAEDSQSFLRLLVRALRAAGFGVGFSEVGIVNVDGAVIGCYALTGPFIEIMEHGAPAIELEHG